MTTSHNSKHIKVALVASAMNCGGLETYLLTLSKELRNKNFEVTIVLTDNKGVWFKKIKEYNIKVKYIPGYNFFRKFIPFGILIHAISVGLIIKLTGFDFIFINHSKSAQFSIFLLSKKVRIFSVLHNDNPEIFRVGLFNHIYLTASICVSDKVREVAINYIPEFKCITIYNGIEIRNTDFKQFKVGDSLRIIFVGRIIEEQKGVFLIPLILSELRKTQIPFKAIIIGDGPDLQELKSKISKFDLDDFVVFYGRLNNEEVMKKLISSHIFLMPSYYEGLPIALLEGMSMACVPIVSNLKGITNICIKNGISGFLIDNRDVMQYVEIIKFLYNNQNEFNLIRKNAKDIIVNYFSSEYMGKQYIDIIEGRRKFILKTNFHKVFYKTKLFSKKEYFPRFVNIINIKKLSRFQNLK